jgi:hypothetical protein
VGILGDCRASIARWRRRVDNRAGGELKLKHVEQDNIYNEKVAREDKSHRSKQSGG